MNAKNEVIEILTEWKDAPTKQEKWEYEQLAERINSAYQHKLSEITEEKIVEILDRHSVFDLPPSFDRYHRISEAILNLLKEE